MPQGNAEGCSRCHGTGALRRVFYGTDPRCPECNAHGEYDAKVAEVAAQVTADFYDPDKRAERAAARRARRADRGWVAYSKVRDPSLWERPATSDE